MKKIILSSLFYLLFSAYCFAANCVSGVAYTTTGAQSCTVPSGITSMVAEDWGGGDGGGSGDTGGPQGGAPGATSGGYNSGTKTVTSGQTINFNIGVAGIGASPNGCTVGGAGTHTTISTFSFDTGTTPGGPACNQAPVAGGTASGGTVNTPGVAGSAILGTGHNGGNGANGPNGSVSGGIGGLGGTSSAGPAGNASAPGAGGGGGGGRAGTGGNGANGQVLFTFSGGAPASLDTIQFGFLW